ncbi:M20/M25/M40 family metallo-hydrolase [Leuconostoc citreum]|uniref:M20/M25/M40 family metallo-hydrolase n=1 Tax=Leuconostoc citreum TaxID=33964 RepID=UPI0032DFC7B3
MKTSKIEKEIFEILHNNPEVSGHEIVTRKIIIEFLNKISNFYVIYNGVEGIVVGNCESATSFDIGYRAELDAMKLQSGEVFHGCGHDAHVTSLLVFINYVSRIDTNKKIMMIFQSSEEFGNGASKLVNIMENLHIHINNIFSVHNDPGLWPESVAVSQGKILATNFSNVITINFVSKGAHFDSSLQSEVNGIKKTMEILDEVRSKIGNNFVLQIGRVKTNGSYSSKSDKLEFVLSMRSIHYSNEILKKVLKIIIQKIRSIDDVAGIGVKNIINHDRIYNSKELCNIILDSDSFFKFPINSAWSSDDFQNYSLISDRICYFFLGSYTKDRNMLHSDNLLINPKFIVNAMYLYLFILKRV